MHSPQTVPRLLFLFIFLYLQNHPNRIPLHIWTSSWEEASSQRDLSEDWRDESFFSPSHIALFSLLLSLYLFLPALTVLSNVTLTIFYALPVPGDSWREETNGEKAPVRTGRMRTTVGKKRRRSKEGDTGKAKNERIAKGAEKESPIRWWRWRFIFSSSIFLISLCLSFFLLLSFSVLSSLSLFSVFSLHSLIKQHFLIFLLPSFHTSFILSFLPFATLADIDVPHAIWYLSLSFPCVTAVYTNEIYLCWW